jgi:hypothetical protein
MLAVLADTTVTGRDVAAMLAGFCETGRHVGWPSRLVSRLELNVCGELVWWRKISESLAD